MERKERLENVKSWRECGGEDAVGVRTVKAAGKKRGKAFSWEFLDGGTPSLASTPGGFDVATTLVKKI